MAAQTCHVVSVSVVLASIREDNGRNSAHKGCTKLHQKLHSATFIISDHR